MCLVLEIIPTVFDILDVICSIWFFHVIFSSISWPSRWSKIYTSDKIHRKATSMLVQLFTTQCTRYLRFLVHLCQNTALRTFDQQRLPYFDWQKWRTYANEPVLDRCPAEPACFVKVLISQIKQNTNAQCSATTLLRKTIFAFININRLLRHSLYTYEQARSSALAKKTRYDYYFH